MMDAIIECFVSFCFAMQYEMIRDAISNDLVSQRSHDIKRTNDLLLHLFCWLFSIDNKIFLEATQVVFCLFSFVIFHSSINVLDF